MHAHKPLWPLPFYGQLLWAQRVVCQQHRIGCSGGLAPKQEARKGHFPAVHKTGAVRCWTVARQSLMHDAWTQTYPMTVTESCRRGRTPNLTGSTPSQKAGSSTVNIAAARHSASMRVGMLQRSAVKDIQCVHEPVKWHWVMSFAIYRTQHCLLQITASPSADQCKSSEGVVQCKAAMQHLIQLASMRAAYLCHILYPQPTPGRHTSCLNHVAAL